MVIHLWHLDATPFDHIDQKLALGLCTSVILDRDLYNLAKRNLPSNFQ